MNRMGLGMGLGLTTIALVTGCADADAPRERSESFGSALVASQDYGDRVESTLTSTKLDESLRIVFDRKAKTARLIPKFGAAKTVPFAEPPASAEAANKHLGVAVAHGSDTGAATSVSAPSAGGTKPKGFEPGPPVCVNPCSEACDARFPDPAQNAACKFGCNQGCAR